MKNLDFSVHLVIQLLFIASLSVCVCLIFRPWDGHFYKVEDILSACHVRTVWKWRIGWRIRFGVVLTRLSLLWGRTMVFSRLLRTIFHRSFRILFSTVFSQTSAKILRLDHTNTQPRCELIGFNLPSIYSTTIIVKIYFLLSIIQSQAHKAGLNLVKQAEDVG